MENLLQKYPFFSRIHTPPPSKKNPGYGPAKKCCQAVAEQLLALEHSLKSITIPLKSLNPKTLKILSNSFKIPLFVRKIFL